MTVKEFGEKLIAAIQGDAKPEELFDIVDRHLAGDDPNPDALRKLVDQAEHKGLDAELATQLRARIEDAEKTAFNIGDDESRREGDAPTGAAPTDDDATVIDESRREGAAPTDDDATLVTGAAPTDDDKTVATGGPEGGDDPFAMSDMTQAPEKSGGGGGGEEHGPGSVLKGRFRLEEVIGQGGMGAVYKAVDLLKVEAKDRNPYMAVKLLVGDFKEHPEAFIALQRESTKAQRLAHPNIATVYDFDRDGDTVYMTMELMQGDELARYIKKLPAGGLPVDEANAIIEQLCAGLSYAHQRNLVHSDFKPGNAFLLDDGTVKLLDFGIARASATKTDAEGETTVFDPGELGALTPAYATVEMFEGKEPDPRDDIYALACVAYELYTGKHPFKKMSAVKAKEKGLKPAPVEKLTKRQNRTLMRGLALLREDRIGSVDEFWEELKPRKDYTWHIAGASAAAVLVFGALLYGPVVNLIHEREYAAILAEVESGEDDRLLAALEQIDALPDERASIVADRGRETIIGYYETLAWDAVDESEGRYNYPVALSYIEELRRFYPDSGQVMLLEQDLVARRNSLVANIDERFREMLDEGVILPRDDEEDITDLVARLRIVNPESSLLDDARLARAYADRVEAAIADGEWTRADEILAVGLDYAPTDASLLNLDDQVQTELRRQAEQQLVAEVRGILTEARPGLDDIASFREVSEAYRQLRELRPDDALVSELATPLRGAFEAELGRLTGAGDWTAADELLHEFARLFALDYLIETREDLTARQVEAGYDPTTVTAHMERLEAARAEIGALLDAAEFDDDWNRALDGAFKDLTALLTPDTDWYDTLREDIVRAHIASARDLVEANRFSAAEGRLDLGTRYMPGLPALENERELLSEAQEAFRIEQAEREREAAISAAKNTVRNQALDNNVRAAVEAFNRLRDDLELSADDEFMTTEGPHAIAEAHMRLAENAAGDGNYSNAVTLAEAGLGIAPNFEPLLEVVDEYRMRAQRAELVTLAGRTTAGNIGELRRQLDRVRSAFPNQTGAINRDVVRALETRIRNVERNDVVAANELHAAALEVFPGNQTLMTMSLREPPRPSEYAPDGMAAIEARELTRATEILQEARRAEPDHHEVEAFARALQEAKDDAEPYFAEFQRRMRANDRDQAQAYLNEAIRRWSDNPRYLEQRQEHFHVTRAPDRADDGSRPCTESLAGHGRRGRAECFDMPAGERGPRLVVVPAPSGGQPFAIGKYEVSVGEFNLYCRETGDCQPLGESDSRPATGITIRQAEGYIAWLSEVTGKDYRLPRESEWVHAANADGNPGDRDDYNCRVTMGGSVIKGMSLVSVGSGGMNGWGLTNHVGNAQEWVRAGGSLVARGGHHEDSLSNCEVGLSRSHDGSADALTGFRVARDLD